MDLFGEKRIPNEYLEASKLVLTEIMEKKPQNSSILEQNAELIRKKPGLERVTEEIESLSLSQYDESPNDSQLFEDLDGVPFKFAEDSPKKAGFSLLKGPQSLDFHELLDHSIKEARSKLQGLRNRAYELYDKGNLELLERAKKGFSSHLKASIKDEKIRQIKESNKYLKTEHKFLRKTPSLQVKEKRPPVLSTERGVDVEDLEYQIQSRQKSDYLRKIKKLVFQLEKRKILQEEKENIEVKQTMTQEAALKLESIKNRYDDKIKMLQERLRCMKIDRSISEKAQKQAIREIQREYQAEKLKKTQTLENFIRQANDLG